jgi:peptidoglycan/LPS O-acetylase OafA/YrhL
MYQYMLSTGAQTIQYFVPTLIGALGWTGYIGQYHTIPLYACAFVFILAASFGSDYYQNKPAFITGLAAGGCVCFIICVASTNHIVQYVFIIFGLGFIYATCPLVLIWVSLPLYHQRPHADEPGSKCHRLPCSETCSRYRLRQRYG